MTAVCCLLLLVFGLHFDFETKRSAVIQYLVVYIVLVMCSALQISSFLKLLCNFHPTLRLEVNFWAFLLNIFVDFFVSYERYFSFCYFFYIYQF